jgi:uncharacterized protein YuzE
MTRDQFVELIRKNLQGSDAPAAVRGKYSERQIQLYAAMAYDDMISILGEEANKSKDYSILDTFGKTYKRNVKYDTERDEKYVELELKVVQLRDNMGIRLVSPYKNQSTSFDYRDNTSQSVFRTLLVDVVDNTPTYYVEASRLYFDYKIPKDLETLMIKIIPLFSELKSDDEILIPGGQNGQVFQRVLELVQNKERHPQMYNNSGSSKQI